jgi:transposase-like protein
MVVEGALEGELDDHLGYGKHDPEGRDGGNSRNGHRAKMLPRCSRLDTDGADQSRQARVSTF